MGVTKWGGCTDGQSEKMGALSILKHQQMGLE